MKLSPERTDLHALIERRTDVLLKQGLVEETLDLVGQGCEKSCRPMMSIGYRQVVEVIQNESRWQTCKRIS